jgi:DNA mismatch repair protein MutS
MSEGTEEGAPIELRRAGDFFEAFGEDAERIAKAVGTVYTSRNGAALIGVPYYATERYAARAAANGLRLVFLEEKPADGRK